MIYGSFLLNLALFLHILISYSIYYNMISLTDFISNNFENCVWLAIIIVSMIPTLESKIAVPLAMNKDIWGESAFSPILAMLIAFAGSLIPSLLIMFISRRLKKRATGFITSKYIQKGQQITEEESNFKKYLLLTGFVAVPFPLTGVWSGSLIAGLTDLDIKWSFLSIAIGSLISSGAITLLCCLFSTSITYILIISLIIIIAFLLVDFFLSFFKRKKSN